MENKKLENYLARLDKALGLISVGEKAEIITEIKSHILDAKNRDKSKSIDLILSSLGEPEQVASKYLIEKGLEPKKPPKHPVIKWLIIGFLGTLSLLLITFLLLIWKFTPIIKVDNNKVQILGGIISINDNDEFNNDKEFDFTQEQTPFIKKFDSSKIKNLIINAKSQDISIIGSSDLESLLTLKPDRRYDKNKCAYSAVLEEDELNIEFYYTSPTWTNLGSCSAKLELTVPLNTNVKLNASSGNIIIKNISGKINNSLGSGNILIDTDSSNIKVSTGSGNIELLFKEIKAKTEVEIKTGSGNATIKAPTKTKLFATHKAGGGKMHNEFGNSENPDLIINAKSGSGSLFIKKFNF